MRNLKLILALIKVNISRNDEGRPVNSSVTWTKNYGDVDNDEGRSVFPTTDRGYILVGTITVQGRETDILLLKLNENGEEEWRKTFGGVKEDKGRWVRQTNDGGFLILGTITFENNTMVTLIKTDSRGELVK